MNTLGISDVNKFIVNINKKLFIFLKIKFTVKNEKDNFITFINGYFQQFICPMVFKSID